MSKAKILAIANHKGGVGKTTTTATIGAILASRGKRVLLVDMDAQANLTTGLAEHDSQFTIYDAIKDGKYFVPVDVKENLKLIPSSEEFASIDLVLAGAMEREYRLKDFLEPYVQNFDYIIIDCPPTLGILLVNALVAADGLIIPTTAEAYPFKGLTMLTDSLAQVQRRLNPAVRLAAILITRWSGRNLNKAVQAQLQAQFGDTLLPTVIRENIKVAEAPLTRKTLIDYDAASNGAIDYENAVNDLLQRI
jgi:chromosome partitioning protein